MFFNSGLESGKFVLGQTAFISDLKFSFSMHCIRTQSSLLTNWYFKTANSFEVNTKVNTILRQTTFVKLHGSLTSPYDLYLVKEAIVNVIYGQMSGIKGNLSNNSQQNFSVFF